MRVRGSNGLDAGSHFNVGFLSFFLIVSHCQLMADRLVLDKQSHLVYLEKSRMQLDTLGRALMKLLLAVFARAVC